MVDNNDDLTLYLLRHGESIGRYFATRCFPVFFYSMVTA